MHLILMTRGYQNSRDIWKMMMQSQWFNWKRKNLLTDKWETIRVQGSLRPIELWEYVFPQESLQEVLAMQNLHKHYNSLAPNEKKYTWVLRKLMGMGVKKIPDMPDLQNKEAWQITPKLVTTTGFAVTPVGIKEDNYKEYDFGKEGKWLQEGL